jgi:uncharacterized protein
MRRREARRGGAAKRSASREICMLKRPGDFVWRHVMAQDPRAAEAFYTSVIGWTAGNARIDLRSYRLLSAGSAPVAWITPIPDEVRSLGARPCWMNYIGVDDVDESARRVDAAEGKILYQPADIPGAGRFAVAADPHGASFILFKPVWEPERAAQNAPGQAGWHELHASDGPDAFNFYSSLFGWTKSDAIDMGAMGVYQIFAIAGVQAGAIITKMPQTPAPFWMTYFIVDSIDAAVARLKEAEGEIINGPMEVPGQRWIVQCLDPQGAAFAMLAPGR